MDANERNPYGAGRRVLPARWGPEDYGLIVLLLSAGPVFGMLAALGVTVGDPWSAVMFGSIVGGPIGLAMTPLLLWLLHGRSLLAVVLVVLLPTMGVAYMTGTIAFRNGANPLVAVPFTFAAYVISAMIVVGIVPRRAASGLCRECGYSLADLRGDVCPECGTRSVRGL